MYNRYYIKTNLNIEDIVNPLLDNADSGLKTINPNYNQISYDSFCDICKNYEHLNQSGRSTSFLSFEHVDNSDTMSLIHSVMVQKQHFPANALNSEEFADTLELVIPTFVNNDKEHNKKFHQIYQLQNLKDIKTEIKTSKLNNIPEKRVTYPEKKEDKIPPGGGGSFYMNMVDSAGVILAQRHNCHDFRSALIFYSSSRNMTI